MADPAVDVEAKVAEKDRQDREIADRRARRRLQRKCFWTRPRGHQYKPVNGLVANCVGCGKERWIGPDA